MHPKNFGLRSVSCVVSFEPMSVLYLALGLIAVYAATVTAMYIGQTWLLFPTALARMARVQLPSSTQHLEVRTPDGERVVMYALQYSIRHFRLRASRAPE